MATPPRLSRAESRARTRAALLDAAARVFVERGFAGTSVEAIAEAAGYTRGAFYSNFASKEEVLAEVLQQRVYEVYREMIESRLDGGTPSDLRADAERLAAIQAHPDGRWLFRLWLEVLAQAGRDPELRRLAAGFWSGNRALLAELAQAQHAGRGAATPVPPEHLATALIALDIGLALQHYVDPEAVPLDLYPELFEALFTPRE